MKDSHSAKFLVQFWGVRGSIPSPGKGTVRYGGNTSCVEMRIDGHHLIFDGGTGLRVLGKSLMKESPLEACLFFTHSHWDRIQGFPFFPPAFLPENHLHIYGASASTGASMKQRLGDQMLHQHFPFPMQAMQSQLQFYNLSPGEIVKLGEVTIETGSLNQFDRAIGYRVTWRGYTAVYATDTEHLAECLNPNLLHLANRADLLIYDAAYTRQQYCDAKFLEVDWGHSTWKAGVEVAKAAEVKQLVMSHHDPDHDDDFLDQIETQVKSVFPAGLLAREGMIIQLNG